MRTRGRNSGDFDVIREERSVPYFIEQGSSASSEYTDSQIEQSREALEGKWRNNYTNKVEEQESDRAAQKMRHDNINELIRNLEKYASYNIVEDDIPEMQRKQNEKLVQLQNRHMQNFNKIYAEFQGKIKDRPDQIDTYQEKIAKASKQHMIEICDLEKKQAKEDQGQLNRLAKFILDIYKSSTRSSKKRERAKEMYDYIVLEHDENLQAMYEKHKYNINNYPGQQGLRAQHFREASDLQLDQAQDRLAFARELFPPSANKVRPPAYEEAPPSYNAVG
jgi:hypothetical protein